MILVSGFIGNVGAELVRMLMAQDDLDFRIAAHTPEKIDRLYGPGVLRVKFDLADQSTWGEALRGVSQVFLLYPLPHPQTVRTWMVPFVEAASRAGVSHIVYVWVPNADTTKLVPDHLVEKAVIGSGMSYIILRASFFAQNFCRDITTHAVDVAKYDQLNIPAGKGVTSFIDLRDVAELALNVLRDPAPYQNRAYALTGPEKLDFYQIADIFAAVLGRRITYPRSIAVGLLAARRTARYVGHASVHEHRLLACALRQERTDDRYAARIARAAGAHDAAVRRRLSRPVRARGCCAFGPGHDARTIQERALRLRHARQHGGERFKLGWQIAVRL